MANSSQLKMSAFLSGVPGIIFDIFMLITPPWFTFLKIKENKSTRGFSVVPYLLALLNGLATLWYDLPWISEKEKISVYIVDIGRICLQLVYIRIFFRYTQGEDERRIKWLLKSTLGVFVTIIVFSLCAFNKQLGDDRRSFCGCVLAISALLTLVPSFGVMATVVKTKDLAHMPFSFSFFVLLSSTCLCLSGLADDDKFNYLPTGLQGLCALLELVLYSFCASYWKIVGMKSPVAQQNALSASRKGSLKDDNKQVLNQLEEGKNLGADECGRNQAKDSVMGGDKDNLSCDDPSDEAVQNNIQELHSEPWPESYNCGGDEDIEGEPLLKHSRKHSAEDLVMKDDGAVRKQALQRKAKSLLAYL